MCEILETVYLFLRTIIDYSINTVLILLILLFAYNLYVRLSIVPTRSPTCLVGKTAIVTGGNAGLGYETVLGLASRGCRVIIADKDDAEKSRQTIIKQSGNPNILAKHLDLSSFKSIRKFAKEINASEPRLDILINNAGAIGFWHQKSEDGLQKLMQVNYFGSFLLTHLLVDLLKKSAPSRILFLTSVASYLSNLNEYNLNGEGIRDNNLFDLMIYSNSKLCMMMTAKTFAEKLKGTGVTSNSVNPGLAGSSMYETSVKYNNYSDVAMLPYYLVIRPIIMKKTYEGAYSTIKAAVTKKYGEESGRVFFDCKPMNECLLPGRAKDKDLLEKVWKKSEEMVQLKPEEKLM